MRFVEVKWRGHDSLSVEQEQLFGCGRSHRVGGLVELLQMELARPRCRQSEHGVFPVQWMGDSRDADQAVLSDARGELDFYLVEKGERDPWAYAAYLNGAPE